MISKLLHEIAEIFRRFSRNENVLFTEAEPAVRHLYLLAKKHKLHLYNDNGLEKEDVLDFFGGCFTWFRDMESAFATAPDGEVIRQTWYRFRDYFKDKTDEERPGGEHPWRARRIPVRVNDEGAIIPEDAVGGKKYETIIPELNEPSLEELAQDIRGIKEGILYRTRQRLKDQDTRESQFYFDLIEEYLRETLRSIRPVKGPVPDQGRKDWVLDLTMKLERLAQTPGKIETLTRIKPYPKKALR